MITTFEFQGPIIVKHWTLFSPASQFSQHKKEEGIKTVLISLDYQKKLDKNIKCQHNTGLRNCGFLLLLHIYMHKSKCMHIYIHRI